PPRIATEPARNDAVDPVGADDDGPFEPAAVAGREGDSGGGFLHLYDVDAAQQFRSGFDGERHQQRVEIYAADHQSGRTVRLNRRRVAVGSFAVQAGDGLGAYPG